MKLTILATYCLCLLSLGLYDAQAQITYVDAGAGNTPNNGWNYRTGLANASDVYEGQSAGAQQLTTTITGLSAGGEYTIYGFFWGSDDVGSWNTDFGLSSGSLTTYGETSPLASTLTYVANPLFTEGNRTLHVANLGTATANGSGEILVYIDNNDGVFDNNTRAWYDGVGFELLGGGGNSAPVFSNNPIAGADATEDSAYGQTLAGSATDVDDDELTYAKVSGPEWLSVANNGALTGTPTNQDVGVNAFTVSVSDGIAPAVQATLNITVINTNDAPVFPNDPIAGATARLDISYSSTLAGSANDDDGDTLTYAKVGGPSWLSVAGNGALTGTPQTGDLGVNVFTISVSDSIAPAVEATLNITVTDTNVAPVFSSNPIAGSSAIQGVAYSSTLAGSASDGDGDPLTYAKVSGPDWLAVAGDGSLSGTPSAGDVGANAFVVSVTDGIIENPVEATLNITVNSVTLPEGVVYVDAVEGASGNTYATGSSLSDTSWIASETGSEQINNQWKKRAFGSGNTVFSSNTSSADSQIELTTEVVPPVDGIYDVYVFFWDAANGANFWDIAADLTTGLSSSDIYSFDGPGNTSAPFPASTLSYDPANIPTLFTESDRTMYAVYLGQVNLTGGASIEVFVDDLTNGGAGNRTWYDGIGYELLLDTDGDGLTDNYENLIIDANTEDSITSFADVMGTGASPAVTDFDNDGSDDGEEYANGTNPLVADSDNDGLLDGVETNTGTYVDENNTGTDPLNDDSDGDGLLDGVETNTKSFVDANDTGTSPVNFDSDGDGINDGFEVGNNTDPNDSTDPYELPAGNPIQVAPDGVWTWFNDERAIWHLGKFYAGYVKTNGEIGVSRFDPATMETTHTVFHSGEKDDHNNPSFTILPDNRLLTVYSRHSAQSVYHRRISTVTEPATINDWGPEVSQAAGGGVSYANSYRLSSESNRIYMFNRAINWNPTLHISDDDGATFGSPIHFIATGSGSKRPYPKYVSNGIDRIDLIYTDGHPRNENNSIYHLYYENGSFKQTDGTLLKAIGDLPILNDSGERGTEVYTYSAAAWGAEDGPDDWIPGARGWTWDICYGKDGHPIVAFQVQVDNVTGSGNQHDRIYYYYARWTGTEWQRRFIAHGGRGIYSTEDDYGGGMAIDPENPDVVYISTNAADPFNLEDLGDVPLAENDRYEIWEGTTKDGGLTFSWQPITVGSSSDNLRPIVPENHGYDRHVVWFRGTYTNYTTYDVEVVGIFQNQLKVSTFNREPGNSEMNFTWASGPGKTYRIMGSSDLLGFPVEVAVDVDSQGSSTTTSFSIPAPLSGSDKAFFRVEEQ